MKYLILFATLLSVLRITGQNDQKAREILEQTSRNMQSFQSISASFSFTMENAKMNLKEKNSGTLVLKGNKYQVKLPDLGVEIFCDSKTVWNFTREANQVTISNAGEEGQGIIDPTAIFNVYREGYDFKFIEDRTVNGKAISFIDLFPEDKGKEFAKITVGIDKTKKVVTSLVTHGKDGNLYGIYVADMKMNQPVADQEFVFNKTLYKDVEMIDFR
jgi:outer membrane lipoprotein-sorting protein